jgi:hypothetical protein
MAVPLGDVEATCEYCESLVRFIPGSDEMQVVRTREEMKYRERVALHQESMRQQLQREEYAAWRQTAAKVAIAALPIVGRTAGRVVFNAALRRGGCAGCGCVLPIVLLTGAATLLAAILR